MNRKGGVIAFIVVLALVVGAVVLLATGGEPPEKRRDLVVTDPIGDLELSNNAPAEEVGLADIRKAEARVEGDQVILEARLGAPVPEQLKDGVFELRWEIDDGDEEWVLEGFIGESPEAELSGGPQSFSASTHSNNFPGLIGTAGSSFTILLKAHKVNDFPRDFTWKLTATISKGAATAKDFAPDEGVGESID